MTHSGTNVPADTSLDAHRAQIGVYRGRGGAGRVAVMFRLNELARTAALAGIRSRHPDYDDERLRLAYARLVLGDEMVRSVWPDRDLVAP